MSRASVMVVDDEPGIRELFRDTLTPRGYDVFTASDGESAVELARHRRPDVAFIDIRMPGMDGVELIKALQSESLCKQYVMITGHSKDDRVSSGIQIGAFACLMKPFSVRDVIGMTEVMLAAA